MKKIIFKNAFMRVLTLVAVALFSHSCIADWPGGEDSANPDSSTAKTMLGFSFTKDLNPALAVDISATISGTDVVLSVPFGTDISALKPNINFFGASVSPASETAQNFSSPVAYTVTAKDGSTQVYTVKVTVLTTSTKDITSFVIKKSLNPDLIDDVTATITGTNITAKLPYGTPLTAIKPTILQNGNIVNSASEVAKDFTNAVSYTVTAQDNSTQVYTVTLTTSQVGDVNPNGTVVGDVYIAGYESNGTKTVAKYWKNGVATSLTDGTQNAHARAIQVVGTDVYVAGYENNGTNDVAKLWKNGVATSLTDGTQAAGINTMTIVGTDVYLGGYESNGTNWVAKLWKNGVATTLTLNGGTTTSYVQGITVNGTDVYVSSYEQAGILWKNGTGTAIAGTSDIGSILIDGADVYAALTMTGTRAGYAKNGVTTTLGTATGRLTSMVISNGDIYMSGSDGAGIFKLWKNGVATNITTGANATVNHMSPVRVAGQDVYVAFVEDISGINAIKLWKNGTITNITDGTQAARTAQHHALYIVR